MSATKAERLMNLLILLLVSRQPVTKEQIRQTIEEYATSPSEEAFEKKFERDKDELRALGIPIELEFIDKFFEDEQGYRVNRSAFELPEIQLDSDEVAVLGVAARVWEHAGLAASTESALLKLRAAGQPVDTSALTEVRTVVTTEDPSFDALLRATQQRIPVTFDYRRPDETSPTTRHLQPWGVVTARGRWYVVGHDLDRGAERLFRLSRISGDVADMGRPGDYEVPEGTDLRALTGALSGPPAEPSVVLARSGRAHGLRRWAASVEYDVRDGWDRLVMPPRSLRSLAGTLRGFGDTVLVERPEELRDLVVAGLEAIDGGLR